jgi:ABC-2 type transport system permease protein
LRGAERRTILRREIAAALSSEQDPPTASFERHDMRASARRIWGMMYRHLALYRSSWPRLLELAYWPVLQMCIWGFTARFLAARMGSAAMVATATLLGGVLLWEVALRSQMGVAISFLEEVWSRNLGHVFVSPLRPRELVAALIGMSIIRTLAGVLPAILIAWVLYAYNLFALGPVLVLLFANLMIMGWWVSLGVVSLILRHGAGAEALAWSVLFGLTPFSAVFYPVSVLPRVVQPLALALPSAHVFEGMRAIVLHGAVSWPHLFAAVVLNAVWLIAASLLFARQFHQARVRGALLSIGE